MACSPAPGFVFVFSAKGIFALIEHCPGAAVMLSINLRPLTP
jgi:hypothetical protein